MRTDVLTLGQQHIRGADSNSLLRLYDLANEILSQSQFQQERARADKAIRHLAKELQKRNVRFTPRHG